MERKGFIKTLDLSAQKFKVVDNDKRIIEGFFTTQDIDRHGDVSLVTAFSETLDAYMKNPVVTYMHDLTKIIGRVVEYKIIDNYGIWIKVEIAKNIKWIDEIWELIIQGMIKGFSYGYSVHEEEEVFIENKIVNLLKKVELYEIAVVSLPMNSNALFVVSSNGEVKSIQLENKEIPNCIDNKSILKNNKKEDNLNEILEEIKSFLKEEKDLLNNLKKSLEQIDLNVQELVKEKEKSLIEEKEKTLKDIGEIIETISMIVKYFKKEEEN